MLELRRYRIRLVTTWATALLTTLLLTVRYWEASDQASILILAVLWGCTPPIWFWYEYFFIYIKHRATEDFHLFKHGQYVAMAIWAGVALSLAGVASSDHFRADKSESAVVISRLSTALEALTAAIETLPGKSEYSRPNGSEGNDQIVKALDRLEAAIRSSRVYEGSVNSQQRVNGSFIRGLGVISLWSGCAILAWLIFAVMFSMSQMRSLAKISLPVALSLAVTGGSLIKFESKIEKLVNIELFIEPTSGSGPIVQPITFQDLGFVKPFPTGLPTSSDKEDKGLRESKESKELYDSLRGLCLRVDENVREGKQPALVVLVGSADKRGLKDNLRRQFGENIALARTRAEWVKENLQKLSPLLTSDKFLLLTTGPALHGQLSLDEMGADRSVSAYIVWWGLSNKESTTQAGMDCSMLTLSPRS